MRYIILKLSIFIMSFIATSYYLSTNMEYIDRVNSPSVVFGVLLGLMDAALLNLLQSVGNYIDDKECISHLIAKENTI